MPEQTCKAAFSFTNDIPFQALIENITDAVILADAKGAVVYANHQAHTIFRLHESNSIDSSVFRLFPQAQVPQITQQFEHALTQESGEQTEISFGVDHSWFKVAVFPVMAGVVGFSFHDLSIKRRLQIISQSQRDAMRLALSGAKLEDVLTVLVNAVEKVTDFQAVSGISLISEDGLSLTCAAAPSMPSETRRYFENITVDERTPLGKCCQIREEVSVQIEGQLDFHDFNASSRALGLQSFWCRPILSAESRTVLGTFYLFHRERFTPFPDDIDVVNALSKTAAIIIERNNENHARRAAESALLKNVESFNKQRRLYETALSNTPDLLYIFDLEGHFTYANDALLQMWGLTWDEAIGKNCLELGYEPWHAEMHMREIRQVIETKQSIRSDVPFNGTNGRRIYDYIFVPVIGEDGNVEAIAGSTRDVTERKQAEEMVKHAEARRRLALEASHSFGIWDWDIKQNIFTADERLGELFNLTSDEAEQGVGIEVPSQYIHPDDVEANNIAIQESINNGTPYNQEYRILQKDGTIRWASFRGRVIYDSDGEPERFPGVGVDTTRERNAIEALKEADRRKDEFLATLAHELRNPLAPIRNALEILQSNDYSQSQKSEAFGRVERQVNQMTRLVDDLMDVSRITRGKIRIHREPVNLCEILGTAIETIQPLIDEKRHTLTVEKMVIPIWVNGDLIRLSQIFSNIINNAAKYTPSGGNIDVQIDTSKGMVTVTVKDNGEGIPTDKLNSVFDMFTQIDGALERSQGGLGIGLTLVKKLTEMHRGSVSVHSDGVGKGTAFMVTLPVLTEVPKLVSKQEKSNNVVGTTAEKLKVLIADDNQDAAITMGWILEAKGCFVKVVEDGPSALEAVQTFIPDLVMLDIGMPGMNGYDLCKLLRENSALANSIFVAQTGWGQPSHIQRSKEVGFNHHLVKPLDLNDLEPIVAQAWQVKMTRKN
ncbi:PAS domain S-box protein [Alteromonas sp. IB21]|uniref:PAS domain S-box protein n=1 Tax=Alteromonas sp. IB21 TaxID=2779369 RepID=UPI0018E833CF|nr:PAS domain S-box protein [Alteromonas sp. IB21]MBJ2130940.1 PAS domain S-box protein [Alteromonas sp. IB21]